VPFTPERDVHLLLSQKAAKVIYEALSYGSEWPTAADDEIIEAVISDLNAQIERPKAAKPKATKKKVKR
jgi:hypothetical protein